MRLRFPLTERNTAPSEFIPTDPNINAALQGSKVPNLEPNGVTIEQMRAAPSLFAPNLSTNNRQNVVQHEMQKTIPDVQIAAQNFRAAKTRITQKTTR